MCNIKYLSPQGRPLRVSPQQPANSTPVPPPPKPKSASTEATKQENEEILNAILPPRYSSSHVKYISQQVQTTLSFISTSATAGNGIRGTNCGCSKCPVRLVQEQMSFTWRNCWTQSCSKGRPERQGSALSAGSCIPSALVRSRLRCW